jgi:oxalate---CoA ligase
LASFKVPRHILFLDQLPKGATGKVQRRRLRELLDGLLDHQTARPLPAVNKGPLDLEAELLTLWRRLLKSDSVTIDDDFFARGGDSLLAMEMLIEVEGLIGQPVPETILFGAETIRQLAPKVAMQTGAPAMPFFQFSASGNRPPLYFFNGDLVSGHPCMRRIVELFGPEYPIISINSHGLHGEPIPPSIEEMAADRLPLILARQASGPFLLGGRCNGAMVAFETARLLMAASHKVDLVAMVDPPTVSARPASRTIIAVMKPMVSPYLLRWTYQLMVELEVFFKGASTSEKIAKVLTRLRIAKLHDGLSNTNNEIPPALWDAYSIAMAQYLPRRSRYL